MSKRYLPKDFHVESIIDVGVAQGTPWLYEEVHAPRIILVEPNADFNQHMEEIGGRIYNVAAGSANGEITINFNKKKPRRSSAYKAVWFEKIWGEVEQRTIPMMTLDAIAAREGVKGPVFLKIDTEGHDLDVLQGAKNLLLQTEAVVCEVSRKKRFEGSYTKEQLFDFMHAQHFRNCVKLRTTWNWWDILFTK